MFKLSGIVGVGIVLVGWSSADAQKMPPEEAHLCSVLEAADAAYEPMRKQRAAETDGLSRERLAEQLDQTVDARNVEILKILGGSDPHVARWVVQLTKIDATEIAVKGAMTRYIGIAGKFPCKLPVTFEAAVLSETYTDFLGAKKVGDYITITAKLISHDVRWSPPPAALEWSLLERKSMAEPEYRLAVEEMNDYMAQ